MCETCQLYFHSSIIEGENLLHNSRGKHMYRLYSGSTYIIMYYVWATSTYIIMYYVWATTSSLSRDSSLALSLRGGGGGGGGGKGREVRL